MVQASQAVEEDLLKPLGAPPMTTLEISEVDSPNKGNPNLDVTNNPYPHTRRTQERTTTTPHHKNPTTTPEQQHHQTPQ
jgi:hypothetical protein